MANNDEQLRRDVCVQAVTDIFPDICLEYLNTIAAPFSYQPQDVINHIIDSNDAGKKYKKRDNRKRKRIDDEPEDDEISEAMRKYSNPERTARGPKYKPTMPRTLIAGDFPYVPHKLIQELFQANGNLLFPTYLKVHQIVRESEQGDKTRAMKKTASRMVPAHHPDAIDETIRHCKDPSEKELLEEFRAARAERHSMATRINEAMAAQVAEKMEIEEARARGELVDCQCCFMETHPNQVVCCDGEQPHWFCYRCARRHAEELVGYSRYEMACMSTDGCDARFSFGERCKFLTPKLSVALDRLEANTAVIMAEIEDLVTCPFCPYAAVCPDVKKDKEFRCENPGCERVSCRICKLDTHTPKTCEEAAVDQGISARQVIEEAMSDAMIRKCNKCNTPFIKTAGCNKMTCTLPGCRNVQCYVCSQSCGYDHFNDPNRGGKQGNCPLFDNSEIRHADEIREAEEKARAKAIEENPGLDPEFLKFKMSEKVDLDDKRRRQGSHGEDIPLYIQQRLQDMPVAPDVPVVRGALVDEEQLDFEVQQVALAIVRRRIAVNVNRKDITDEQWPKLQPEFKPPGFEELVGEVPFAADDAAVRFFHENYGRLIQLGVQDRQAMDVRRRGRGYMRGVQMAEPAGQRAQAGQQQGQPGHQHRDLALYLRVLDNGPPFLHHGPPFDQDRRHLRDDWRDDVRQILREGAEDMRRQPRQPPAAQLHRRLQAYQRAIRRRNERDLAGQQDGGIYARQQLQQQGERENGEWAGQIARRIAQEVAQDAQERAHLPMLNQFEVQQQNEAYRHWVHEQEGRVLHAQLHAQARPQPAKQPQQQQVPPQNEQHLPGGAYHGRLRDRRDRQPQLQGLRPPAANPPLNRARAPSPDRDPWQEREAGRELRFGPFLDQDDLAFGELGDVPQRPGNEQVDNQQLPIQQWQQRYLHQGMFPPQNEQDAIRERGRALWVRGPFGQANRNRPVDQSPIRGPALGLRRVLQPVIGGYAAAVARGLKQPIADGMNINDGNNAPVNEELPGRNQAGI
ncbi:Fc.00g092140.m01.CDS01 [Cosmosporella sp. VM-42]